MFTHLIQLKLQYGVLFTVRLLNANGIEIIPRRAFFYLENKDGVPWASEVVQVLPSKATVM